MTDLKSLFRRFNVHQPQVVIGNARQSKAVLIILCSVFALVLVSTGCRQHYVSGDYTRSLQYGGLERTYSVHIPPSLGNKQIALVIALHGGGGSAEAMRKLTQGGFDILADKDGFIVVYPDGVENQWNDGREGDFSRAHRENIDDVGFISALIDRLAEEYNIDKKRVYATGISNGAFMSYRLACELSDKLAAIAPVAGEMPANLPSLCSPSRPISVLIINNTYDRLVPWNGGPIAGGRGTGLSVAESVKFWVIHNNCSPSPTITELPDTDPQDGTRVQRAVYGQGKDGTEVVLYAIEGGGHTWPGGYQYLSEILIGKTSRDIDANEIIWNFFKNHAIK